MDSPASRKVSADDYVAILNFYAHQMHVLDSLKIEEYADTFTEDGVVDHAHRGERAEGRDAMLEGMRAALPRYRAVVVRHWFDHFLIEPMVEVESDTEGWRVSYYSLVTRTDGDGKVDFEPTFTVEDELVRTDSGAIRTRRRVIHQDKPANSSA